MLIQKQNKNKNNIVQWFGVTYIMNLFVYESNTGRSLHYQVEHHVRTKFATLYYMP